MCYGEEKEGQRQKHKPRQMERMRLKSQMKDTRGKKGDNKKEKKKGKGMPAKLSHCD